MAYGRVLESRNFVMAKKKGGKKKAVKAIEKAVKKAVRKGVPKNSVERAVDRAIEKGAELKKAAHRDKLENARNGKSARKKTKAGKQAEKHAVGSAA
jgi:transcriptional/translational regulatory protein YebC/TACO1